MTRQQILGVIGLWTLILPFLGFPNDWKLNMVALNGLIILILYWKMRKESQAISIKTKNHGAGFVENSIAEKPNQANTEE